MKIRDISRVTFLMFVLILLVILATLAYLGVVPNSERIHNREYPPPIPITWYEIQEAPSAESPTGVMRTYTWTIDRMAHPETNLSIAASHQYLRIYVDGKLQYSLMPAGAERVSKTLGKTWVFVPIYHDDFGKEVRVEALPVYESALDQDPDFLMGSKMLIASSIVMKELPLIILSMLLIASGLFCVLFDFINRKRWKRGLSLGSMGLFAILIGICRLCDSWALALLFPYSSVLIYHVSMFSLMLSPIPLTKSVKPNLHPNCRIIADCCAVFAMLVFILQIILQHAHVADLRETMALSHIMLFICGFMLLGCILYSRFRKGWHLAAPSGRMLGICLACVAADLVLYYVRRDSTGLFGLMAGLQIYLLIYAVQTLVQYAKMESQLVESRTAIMISQIQPHFVFNSLTAIAQLCEKDPHRAKKTIISFSEYLRGNMDSIQQSKLVSFQRELEHLQRYISLEQLRFGDELIVEFDLECKDFYLPALTVQPLVENAIKHGIGQKNGGGTVLITTRETRSAHVIEVRDDGVGFKVGDPPRDERSHIGISNVAERLRMMCSGTLEIESEVGKGTCVRVTIPRSASPGQS